MLLCVNVNGIAYRLFPFHRLDELFVHEMCILAALLDQNRQLILIPAEDTKC